LDLEDMDLSYLPAGARYLSMTDVVREQVLLALPSRVLCRPACAGLCARCGADLNAGPCSCPAEPEVRDVRFASLAQVRKRLEKT
jgi:uncharacterized protein